MARSQIIAHDDILSMEPKVLQVLLILAENQGKVVSHDHILKSVWPDTVIGANAIQRCIAQLRKAFKDDAKTQAVIATHPKVGYSLLADVNWQAELGQTNNSAPSTTNQVSINAIQKTDDLSSKKWPLSIALVLLMLVAVIGMLSLYQNQPTSGLTITSLKAITATDNKELQPSYSPDGRYIAFQRFVDACENQLWAKDTHTNKEYLLTEEVGIYGTPSWSPDGSQIAFASVTHCRQHQQLEGCTEIRGLSFALATSAPQATRPLLTCQNQHYSSPVWLTDHSLALISRQDDHDALLTLSLTNNQLKTRYRTRNSLQSLDYSRHLNLLALIKSDQVHNATLLIVDPKSEEFSETALLPDERHKYRTYWGINWHPNQASLITAADKSLYSITLDGEFTEHRLPNMQYVFGPKYHPTGDSLVAAMGTFDPDVGQLHWQAKLPADSTQLVTKQHIFARSTVLEEDAKYQPNGELVAFVSDRNGNKQIWLTALDKKHTSPYQLSFFPQSDNVQGFVWAQDGNSLIVNAQRKLYLLNLAGDISPIELPFEVLDIYHTLDNNQVLIKAVEQQNIVVKQVDLERATFNNLYTGDVYSALLTEQKQLYVIDQNYVLSQVKNQKAEPLTAFNHNNIFSLFQGQNNTLLIATDKGVLWHYTPDSKNKTLFLAPQNELNKISDISLDNQSLLYSQLVSIHKEIVLLR